MSCAFHRKLFDVSGSEARMSPHRCCRQPNSTGTPELPVGYRNTMEEYRSLGLSDHDITLHFQYPLNVHYLAAQSSPQSQLVEASQVQPGCQPTALRAMAACLVCQDFWDIRPNRVYLHMEREPLIASGPTECLRCELIRDTLSHFYPEWDSVHEPESDILRICCRVKASGHNGEDGHCVELNLLQLKNWPSSCRLEPKSVTLDLEFVIHGGKSSDSSMSLYHEKVL